MRPAGLHLSRTAWVLLAVNVAVLIGAVVLTSRDDGSKAETTAPAPEVRPGDLSTYPLPVAAISDFETSTGTWAEAGNVGSIRRSRAVPPAEGRFSAELVRKPSPEPHMAVVSGGAAEELYKASAGERYAAIAHVRAAPAADNRYVELGIEWFDKRAVKIAESDGKLVDVGRRWTRLEVLDEAPPTAVAARLRVRFRDVGPDEVWFLDEAGFSPA